MHWPLWQDVPEQDSREILSAAVGGGSASGR